MEFDYHILNCATILPHATTYQMLLQTAREELSRLPLEDRLINRVASIIERQFPHGLPPLSRIAEELQLSPRSLQRHIHQSGTSFKQLAEDTRKAQSLDLLVHDDISMTTITARLGFSCQSAFNRAFKRWFGLTPARYREQLQCL